jgi:hypothetical protein
MARSNVAMIFMNEPLTVAELRPDSHTTWSLQWKMKAEAIAEIERVERLLSAEQLASVNVAELLDDYRLKLVIALLMDQRIGAAVKAVQSIRSLRRLWQARLWLGLGKLAPKRMLAPTLRSLWLWRQDRSFEWTQTPPTILAAIAE